MCTFNNHKWTSSDVINKISLMINWKSTLKIIKLFIALDLIQKCNFKEVHPRLAWSLGEEESYLIEAYEVDVFGILRKIDNKLLPHSVTFKIESIIERLNLYKKKKK